MENQATINSTVTEGGTINSTVVTSSSISSTIVGGAQGATGEQGIPGEQGVPGPPGPGGTYYDVSDYGALGNGVHNDTTPIQNAIAAASAAGGGTVFFPGGTFLVSATLALEPGISLLGVGATASVILQSSTVSNGITLVGTSVVNASLSIQALGVTGPGSGSGNGINISGEPLVYVSLRDVAVQSFGQTGVYIGGSIVTTLERVTSTTNGLHGFWIDGTSSFVTSTSLINCYGNDNSAAGIYIYKATYCSLTGCAADSNGIGYLLSDVFSLSATGCGTESSQSHGISGYPGIGWKVIGDSTFGSGSVSLNGCFVYDVHDIAYWITGFTTGVSLNACIDSTPHSGATYSLQVDSTATVSSVACEFAGSNNITGAYVVLSDSANSYSYLRQAYANGITLTDSPTSLGTSLSNLFITASAGTNYIESVGANNSGAAALIIGSQFLGVEYVAFSAAGAATFPNAVTLSSTLTVGGVTSTGATGTGNIVFSASPTITGTATLTTVHTFGNLTMEGGADVIMNGSTSGAITLQVNATAGTATITFPGTTGTVTVLGNTTTGSGSIVLATSPTLTTPALGTPSSATLTNATGLPVTGISATGSATSSTFLRGDGSWQAVSAALAVGSTTISSGTNGYLLYNNSGTLGNIQATATPTASVITEWDANLNLSANNIISGFSTTATAAGTTTLTITSPEIQVFTGSTTQTVKLPTTGVVAGAQYTIINQSTGAVTVQSSGSNTVTVLAGGTSDVFTAVVATPTTAANWGSQYLGVIVTSGKSLSITNSGVLNVNGKTVSIMNNMTFSGTDGTTMTFPSTTASVARTDAGQTFTGANTFNGNVTLGTAGNKLLVTTGSNAAAGTGTLSGGTATISTTAVTASSLIFLTDTASSLTNVGTVSVSAKAAGTSFTVTSSNALDTSTFNWLIIN